MKIKGIGVAFGGGGARGAAHIGVLRRLDEIDLQPGLVTGTSAGAVVASLYAFGISNEDIANELKQLKLIDFKSLTLNGLGFVENVSLIKLIEKLLPENCQIEDAKIPLVIVATDLISGESVYLDKGCLKKALAASTAIPGFFIPQEIEERLLVDGGFTENVPVLALKKYGAQYRIGICLGNKGNYPKPENFLDVISQSMDVAIDAKTHDQLNKFSHIQITMDLHDYSRTSPRDFDKLIEEGYQAAKILKNEKQLYFYLRFKRVFKKVRDLIPLKFR